MKVGFVGCGKLGLMVALTIESRSHEVKGYDTSCLPAEYLRERRIPFEEKNSHELLHKTKMEMVSLEALCDWADILFLAPQTPHRAEFDGTHPLTEERADFDYSFLKDCVQGVGSCLKKPTTCVVISTVLPGTLDREIIPFLSPHFRLVYSPQFIAMGTVFEDFLHPEFWLIGSDEHIETSIVKAFYKTIAEAPVVATDIRTAEGIKVFYNTFITAKTVLANLYGEMAHRCDMNVNDIHKAITLSTKRLLSSRYLEAGMGDGGGCHPRDNIALSWLAREKGLSFDFFEALMMAREKHAEWLADEIREYAPGNHVIILGRAFKPETKLSDGAPSKLISNILAERGIEHVWVDDFDVQENECCSCTVFFIGCKNERYAHKKFPKGSVVIDPFRYIPDQEGVCVIRIGEGGLRLPAQRLSSLVTS